MVDFILQMANVSEQQVTPEELMAEPDAEGEAAAAGEKAAGGDGTGETAAP